MSIKKKALHNIIGRFIEFLFSIATPIILIRIFSQDNYGSYQQIIIIGSLIVSIVSFNIPHNLYYFYPIAKNKKEQSIILSHTFFSLLIIGFFSCLLILSLLILYWNFKILF